MQLLLNRNPSVDGATLGEITQDGRHICYTLEDQVREIEGEPPSAWKQFGQTAIPRGNYLITLEDSPHFGPDTLTVNYVPGFVGVRMHAGNTIDDTEGCILLGMSISDTQLTGGTSRPAVELVKTLVSNVIKSGDSVMLQIS